MYFRIPKYSIDSVTLICYQFATIQTIASGEADHFYRRRIPRPPSSRVPPPKMFTGSRTPTHPSSRKPRPFGLGYPGSATNVTVKSRIALRASGMTGR